MNPHLSDEDFEIRGMNDFILVSSDHVNEAIYCSSSKESVCLVQIQLHEYSRIPTRWMKAASSLFLFTTNQIIPRV